MQTHPKIPKYWKLSQSLREQIENGTFPVGARLPSVAEIQAQHGVSLSTVNQAHALLEKDGLIVREQGRGTFVAERKVVRATKKLGLVLHMHSASSPYTVEWLAGVREEAVRQNFELSWLRDEDVSDPAKADAILFFCHPTEALALPPPPQTPHALLFQYSADLTCVVADDFTGTKMATQHLLKLGHRRIAYLLADSGPISRRRLAGYQSALQKVNIQPQEKQVRFLDQPGIQNYCAASESAMQTWLAEDFCELGCTAILAHNDESAIGVVKALAASQLRVPEDVSVVGFDGTALCELSTPALTTVRVPLREIGAAAVKTLAQQMKQGVSLEAQKIVLPVQLKIGASTAPIAIRSKAKASLHK